MLKIKNAFIRRINVRPWFYALVMGCFSLTSNAAVRFLENGSTTTIVFPSNTIGGSSTYFEVPSSRPVGTTLTTPPVGTPAKQVVGGYGVAKTPSGQLAISGYTDVPVKGTSLKIPNVLAQAKVPAASVAKAITLAAKIAWPIGAIMAAGDIYDLIKDLDGSITDLKSNGDAIHGYRIKSGKLWTNPGGVRGFTNPLAACQSYYGSNPDAGGVVGVKEVPRTNGDQYWCLNKYGTEGGVVYAEAGDSTKELVTQQEIEDMIAANTTGWPSSAARALASSLNTPGVSVDTEPLSVSGPASVPAQKTTITENVRLKSGTNIIADSSDTNTDSGTKNHY